VKRRAFKLLLLLIAGGIINVAVAWGCVLASIDNGNPLKSSKEITERVLTPEERRGLNKCGWIAEENPRLYKVVQRQSTRFAIQETRITEVALYLGGAPILIVTFHEVGWPLYAVGGGDWVDYSSHAPYNRRQSGLIRISRMNHSLGFPLGLNYFFPWRPLWPGFAINTIFYAAIVWFLFFAPGAIRKRVRRKRGQCAACGYSRRGTPGSDVCPECGATASASPFGRRPG
jgi:hypothetical protein